MRSDLGDHAHQCFRTQSRLHLLDWSFEEAWIGLTVAKKITSWHSSEQYHFGLLGRLLK